MTKGQEVKAKKRRITFTLEALSAQEVILMGDFNKWNPKKHAMKAGTDGIWKKTVMLEPGRYEYKFLVDGEWHEDPLNREVCVNCFGTQNNVVNVS